MEKTVVLIGLGNLGSRHLQAIKKTRSKLNIFGVDPSPTSREIATARYEEVTSKTKHKLTILETLDNLPHKIDVAIIATNSDVRARLTKSLLNKHQVKYLILEKLLFTKRGDYAAIGKLLDKSKCKAFVNCSMRYQDFYKNLPNTVQGSPVNFSVTGSNYGLITNSIHYLDYVSYITDCYDFKINLDNLSSKPIKSKRKGFLEFTGTILATYSNGSSAIFTDFGKNDTPVQIEIRSSSVHVSAYDGIHKAMISSSPKWDWKLLNTAVPYQSNITNKILEDIFSKGSCNLTPYNKSQTTHTTLLEALRKHLNKNSKTKYKEYPFT